MFSISILERIQGNRNKRFNIVDMEDAMIWFILPILIMLYILLRTRSIIISILVMITSYAGTILFGMLAYESLSKEVYKDDEYTIVSINSSQHMRGEFFLGVGHIEEKMIYVAYKKVGDEFQLVYIPASKSIILKDSTYYGSVCVYKMRPRFPKWKLVAIGEPTIHHYIIHVPKGTILKQFIL